MHPASQNAICNLSKEASAPRPASHVERATFTIEVHSGALIDANAAGWTAWGLDPAGAVLPIAIDCAMPALQDLREVASRQDQASGGPLTLTFWTARGLVQLACSACTIAAPGASGGAVLVQSLHAVPPPAVGKPFGERSPAPGRLRSERDHGLDVALDAWLAHELRTPLSAVIAYAEILKNEHFGPIANPRYKSYASDIYNSARHALGVVDSLLHEDRARTALPVLAFADLDPAAVIEGCLTVARPLADRAGLELGADLGHRLPRVIADEQSLRQMLLNLLSNAIKFARPGDRVSVAVAYEGDGPLIITVADTGPGMDAAAQEGQTGLGLGLPLTRTLAAANGARLAVESTPGRGTRVTIAFGKDRVVPV